MSTKKIAYILQQSPYGCDFAHDAIDAVLAGGLYGQNVSVFFSDDGVFQLLKTNNTTGKEYKSLSKKLSALSLYDIEQVYACNDSLTLRGVSAEQLSMDVDCLDKETFENTLRTHDIILSF